MQIKNKNKEKKTYIGDLQFFFVFVLFPLLLSFVFFQYNINLLLYLCLMSRNYSKRVCFYISFSAAQNSTAFEIFAGSNFCDFSSDPQK